MRSLSFLGLFISSYSFALTVGVTAGPHADILYEVQKDAEKAGLSVQVKEFNDFIIPNMALEQKEIDLNSYQHLPFLEDQVKTRGFKLVSIGKTILLPLGIYSQKHKNLDQIAEGSKITIPNDPTNGGRALLLLEKLGFIKLRTTSLPSILDITQNLKKVKIIEMDAPQLARTLKDVDFGVVNTDWILLAGENPDSALARENKDSPYSNLLVVRQGDEKNPEIQKFLKIYQSPKIKEFIVRKYRGAIIPAW